MPSQTLRRGPWVVATLACSAVLLLPALGFAAKLSPLWIQRASGYDGVVGERDVVVGNGRELRALDKETGTVAWTLANVFSVVHQTAFGPLLFQCSNWADGSWDHPRLRAVELATGHVAWSLDLPDFCRSLAAQTAVIYVLTGQGLERLDSHTGRLVWSVEFQDPCCEPAERRALTVWGDTLFVTTGKGLEAWAASDGHLRWRADLPEAHWALDLFAVPTREGVLVAYDSGPQHSTGWRMTLLDRATGDPLWATVSQGEEWPNAAAVQDGVAFVGTNLAVRSYSLADAHARWSTPCLPAKQVVPAGEQVLAVCEDAGPDARLASLDAATGTVAWRVAALHSGCCFHVLGVDAERVYMNHWDTYTLGRDGSEPVVLTALPPRGAAGVVAFVLVPALSAGLVTVAAHAVRRRPPDAQ